MRRPPGETLLLLVLTLGPAMLLGVETILYDRSLFTVGAPFAAAGFLVVLGMAAASSHASDARDPGITAPSAQATLWLAVTVAAILLIGPRLAAPVFGFIFARAKGGSLPAALATGAVCVLLIETILIRTLGVNLPFPAPFLRMAGF